MSDKEQTIEFMQKNIATANDRISTLLDMKANRELHHYEWKWEESWCAVELDQRNREVSFFETAIAALKSQSAAEGKIEKVMAECEKHIGLPEKDNDGEYSVGVVDGREIMAVEILTILEVD